MIRKRMQDGIVKFCNAQIYDQADTGVCELLRQDKEYIPLELGKSAARLLDKVQIPVEKDPWHIKFMPGVYFYLWSKPLTNYYHCILDALGCLHYYFKMREKYPDIVLLINRTPRMGLEDYPPFVNEMFDLLNITWAYTDPTVTYEYIYFGDTLNQNEDGKRIRPDPAQWQLIDRLVQNAKSRVQMPVYNKIYLSRRAHANPLNINRKAVIGEDNTVKRGLVNEDSVVDILTDKGYIEVFGENYTLAEKIVMFSQMDKYISAAGAGVTNMLWVRDHDVSVGGIHTPGFPFPGPLHKRHICTHKPYSRASINIYKGKTVFEDPQPTKGYNHPWRIDNLTELSTWAETI